MQVTGFLVQIRAIAVVLLLVPLLISCSTLTEQDRQAVMDALTDSLERNSEIWNVEIDIIEDRLRRINIQSPYATSLERQEGTLTTLYGPVFIKVRDSTGAIETTVTANKAYYHGRKGEFNLEKDVRVETAGNRKLYTDELMWFQNRREIETPAFVIITTPKDSISGYGLVGDDRLEFYTINRVTGSITIETSGSDDDPENELDEESGS